MRVSESAQRDLRRILRHIARKLFAWVLLVEQRGLDQARKIPGYHDEPLHGDRRGQRSIRLNRSYRAIYVIRADKTIEFVSVEEVSKHGY